MSIKHVSLILLQLAKDSYGRAEHTYSDPIERADQIVAQASNFSSIGVLVEGILKQLHKQCIHASMQRIDVRIGADNKPY